MEVNIKGVAYEYQPDFPNGWNFARGDHFKFPVVIGPEKCFIKRFDKHTDNITGWRLLQHLAGVHHHQQPAVLAAVYDTVSEIENNRIVHYVFFEFVDGNTLYDCILERAELNLAELSNNLFAAIQLLQNDGYWFPDFCEKNIFRDNNQRFLLIDLDSTYPVANPPDSDMWGAKDYWVLVMNFCKTYLHYDDVLPADFNGTSFNCLHAVFLILRLKIFYSNPGVEYESLFDQLPGYLHSYAPSFDDIVTRIYSQRQQPLKPENIAAIKALVIKEIVAPAPQYIQAETKHQPVTELYPVINTFEVIHYLEKTDDYYQIIAGQRFQLQWDVQHATNIALYRNGKLYQEFDVHAASVELTEEVYDTPSRKVKYTLTAQNSDAKAERNLVAEIIFQSKDVPDSTPPFQIKIKDFSVKTPDKQSGNQNTIVSGIPFILQWDVENAQTIELYRNGTLNRQLGKDQNAIEMCEVLDNDTETLIEYTLAASNSNDKSVLIKKSSLQIRIIHRQETLIPTPDKPKQDGNIIHVNEPENPPGKPKTWILALSIIAALAIIILLTTKLTKSSHKNSSTDTTATSNTDTSENVSSADTATSIETPIAYNYKYYDSLGTVFAQAGNYNKAKNYYDTAIQMNADDREAYYRRAKANYQLQYYNQSVDDFTKAIELELNDGSVFYERALAQKAGGKKSDACSDFEKSCNLGYNRGCIAYETYCKAGDEQIAYEKKDREGKKNKPVNAIQYLNSGDAKANAGNYEDAISDYTQAIRLDRSYTGAYFQRGFARYKAERYAEAVDDFITVIKLNKNYPKVYYRLGLATLSVNNKSDACKYFKISCDRKEREGCLQYNQLCNGY